MALSSCQTLNKDASQELQPGRYSILHDFAPSGPIPTFFKAIIPRDEPRSKYGNPSSYRVGGKTYYVLRTAQGYHAKGNASWYASKFHKQRTSSGEPYNMYALSAAHRTLPIPSYLRVTNLQNGRSTIVRVNDRGPFHSDRIIDLSYGAAVQLGIFPKGTAPVAIEAVSTIQTNTFLQVGVFKNAQLAQQFRKKLLGWTSQGIKINQARGNYVVLLGPIKPSDSMQMKKILLRHGIKDAFIVTQR